MARVVLLAEIQTVLARVIGEPMNTMLEVRRYNSRLTAEKELQNLPIRERGRAWVRESIRELFRAMPSTSAFQPIGRAELVEVETGKGADALERRPIARGAGAGEAAGGGHLRRQARPPEP